MLVISIFILIGLQSTRILIDVEVEAKSFVPKIGHLGQREPLVQPATEGEEQSNMSKQTNFRRRVQSA